MHSAQHTYLLLVTSIALVSQYKKFLGFCRKIEKSDYELHDDSPFVRPSAWNNSARTGRIFLKFSIWIFFVNPLRNPNLIKILQERRALYMKTAYIYDNISPNSFCNEKCFRHML
jgi:hypothetical protein